MVVAVIGAVLEGMGKGASIAQSPRRESASFAQGRFTNREGPPAADALTPAKAGVDTATLRDAAPARGHTPERMR
jgi:hypothetical protein